MAESWDIEKFPLATTAAFDPAKPVDPDWHEKGPGPLLRSGDEGAFLNYEDEDKIDLGGEGQHPGEDHEGVDEYVYVPPSIYEAAEKKTKPKKPPTPEERRRRVIAPRAEDSDKPGAMSAHSEHFLERSGWKRHEIHERGRTTIMYRHQDHPNTYITYGGKVSGDRPFVLNEHGKRKEHFARLTDLLAAHQRYQELGPLGRTVPNLSYQASWDIDRFPVEHFGATGYPSPGKTDWAPDVQSTRGGENDINFPYSHADAATEKPKPPPVVSADAEQSDITDWGTQYGGPPDPTTKPAQPKTTPAVTHTWPKKKGAGDPTEWKRQQRAKAWEEIHPKVHGTPDGATFGRGDRACSDCFMAGTIEQHYPDIADHVQWPIKDGVATLKSGMQLTADDLRTWFGAPARKPTWSHSDIEPDEGWDSRSGQRRRLASEAWWVVSS